MPAFYRVRSASVVSEIIDGEAIILDLRSGLYFSAQDAAAVIWDGLAAGFPLAVIEARLTACFEAEPASLQAGISAFISELIDNDLIEAADRAESATGIWITAVPEEKPTFISPVLNVYGDLQDLAQLDPIHDVEAAGWPNRRADLPPA